jgi:hypothetical protein
MAGSVWINAHNPPFGKAETGGQCSGVQRTDLDLIVTGETP